MSPRPRIPLLLRAQPDERLAALAAQGSEPAFTALIERHRGELRRAVTRAVPEAAGEDVLQDTFLRAWRALQGGERVDHPRAWLHRIARNAAVDAARRGLSFEELHEAVEAPGAVEEQAERRRLIRATLAGVAELPEAQRHALLATAVGCTRAEIAAELGLSEGAVRQLVLRARTTMRQGMAAVTPLPVLMWALRRTEALPVTAQRLGELASSHAGTAGAALVAKGAVSAAILATGATIALEPSRPAGPPSPVEPRSRVAMSVAPAPSDVAWGPGGTKAEPLRKTGRRRDRAGSPERKRPPRRRDRGAGRDGASPSPEWTGEGRPAGHAPSRTPREAEDDEIELPEPSDREDPEDLDDPEDHHGSETEEPDVEDADPPELEELESDVDPVTRPEGGHGAAGLVIEDDREASDGASGEAGSPSDD